MPAKALMVQGTASHVGKSVLTTALCRLFSRQGLRVAPFKGMNMSNNASVTPDGFEIATAQAVQAKACGIEPTAEMNPVLLKTESDSTCQVILEGRPFSVIRAGELASLRVRLLQAIEVSLHSLMERFDVVVMEGAGSPAEVNLKETDFANMAVARMAEAKVLLVGDIERGGVFAQLVGTLDLLEEEERSRIAGLLINKFRGDLGLLQPGVEWLEKRTGKPICGVIPFFHHLRIPQEDALGIPVAQKRSSAGIRVQVIRYPTIANFTDFDPLCGEPGVSVEFLEEVTAGKSVPDLLILPGSKSTMADLSWLRRLGFDRYIARCVDQGVGILGICGGFQMLGERIHDPQRVESDETSMQGLGWFPASTVFSSSKVTTQVEGVHMASGHRVRGYEIHQGQLHGPRQGRPLFQITKKAGQGVQEWEGCEIPGRKIWGTYLHGLFDEPDFRRYFLKQMQPAWIPSAQAEAADPFDALADGVRAALDWEKIKGVIPWIRLP